MKAVAEFPDSRRLVVFTRVRRVVFAIVDMVSRRWIDTLVSVEESATQVQVIFEHALELEPENAEVNYHAGLFYVTIGNLDEARKRAAVAYEHGYPLLGLRNKIAAAEKKSVPVP